MSFFQKKPAAEPQNIDEVLAQFNDLKEQYQALKNEFESLKKENLRNISKIGIVRFNPFEGLGSNQSFSLVILNDANDGAVITSLFSRESNRVYGKPIKNGTSEFKLAREEKNAIEIAQNKFQN
jgi:N-methylhydantoinase A/oxoprolinase/acetone carboxylase beta subunit